MCTTPVKRKINKNIFFAVSILLGVVAGYIQNEMVFQVAETISQLFLNLLKLVSLPIIFLSIVSTASGMETFKEITLLGKKVLKYTIMTTVISATVALVLFLALDPVKEVFASSIESEEVESGHSPSSYLSFFIKAIPSNIIQPFYENNVIGVLFLALLFSFAILSLNSQERGRLHSFFSSLYSAIVVMTRWVVYAMPMAIWAFFTLLMKDMQKEGGLGVKSLALYLLCVVGANLIQGGIVLPTLLKWKNVSPFRIFRGMLPALSVAFFTKSSAATLPMAMRCAEENIGVSKKISSFTLPLCTTINMNGCAAFILITVLFVSMSNGATYTLPEMILWIILSTIAAIGNAGVPMGCYFLSSAFLAAMNVPLHMLGIILPFYALIDMLETAINVWSDSCIAAIVQQELGNVLVEESAPQDDSSLTSLSI